jgi:DnaK suppressor protein
MTTYSPTRALDPNTDRAGQEEEHRSATTRDLVDQRGRREALSRDHDTASQAVARIVAEPQPDRLARSAASNANPPRGPVEEPAGPEPASMGTAGPSACLRALPQPTAGQLATTAGVEGHLAELQVARQAQLDALAATACNVVAAAHRDTVVWILDQIRTARRRLGEGSYSICARCGTSIGPDRLTMQPWQTTCNPCGLTDRWARSLPPATGT